MQKKQTYIFEIAKLGGMLVFVIITFFAFLIYPDRESTLNEIIINVITRFISGYIAISVLFLILNRLNKKDLLSSKLFISLFVPGCYAISLVWILLYILLFSIFEIEALPFNTGVFVKALSFIYIVIAFTGLHVLISHWLKLKEQREMTRQATNLANEAQLQMLRYQINPHFLFNSLNTIRSMVEEDKNVAREMITQLSNFFRYSLSQTGTTDTLANEINAIKNYLEIQKIRFDEKLCVIFDIDENVFPVRIPFFIILPLVENALKFGLQSSSSPLTIKIVIKANHHLEISVQNTGHLVECEKDEEGTKTGIENTKKRLALHLPNNHSFSLFEKDSWVISQIIIFDYKSQLGE